MKNILLLLFTFLTFSLSAQVRKTIHQTFEVGEVASIFLDLHGEYELEPWPGNTVLSETKIEIYDASPAILKFFAEDQKRYEITEDAGESRLTLTATDKVRKAIRYKDTECYEAVKLKLYVPEDFEIVNPKTLRKKE